MSRHQQDANSQAKSRQRANTTTSFAQFASWRRTRADALAANSTSSTSPAIVSQLPLRFDALVEALTPPSVPSLAHARALASMLQTQSPLPARTILNPILASLCSVDSPVSLQAVGYDIISAYLENNEMPLLTVADRLSYVSLFLDSVQPWAMELWEPRFKALRALTKYGADVVGIEMSVLNLLKFWLKGAFEGLMKDDLDRAERAERERSVDVLAKFISTVLEKSNTVGRLLEQDLISILDFYAALVDMSFAFKPSSATEDKVLTTEPSSNASTPARSSPLSHRRNQSSVSVTSLPSPSSISPPVSSKITKHPADISITLYLDYLVSQVKTLPPSSLHSVLPFLFRALAYCATPLPRLTVMPRSASRTTSEDRITDTLDSLLAGPYSATCMLILKKYLFPPEKPSNNRAVAVNSGTYFASVKLAAQTALGAFRAFRNYVRRALTTRLARAYISRETSMAHSPSGAPGHMDLERDLMERAWPKEDYASSTHGLGGNGWDAGRLGKVLTASVDAWVQWQCVIGTERDWDIERSGKENVLDEAAGVLKDIWQELDAQEDENGGLDEEEAAVIGETLQKLVMYVLPLKNPDGTPFILPISRTSESPTPFLRSLTSLLSRDHAIPTNPSLSTILISIADHLTDVDTAHLPRIMTEQHDLSPTSPDWLKTWHIILFNQSLLSANYPQTRRAIMDALQVVYESVREMKGYRRLFADMVLNFCKKCVGDDSYGGIDGSPMWRILGDEVVLRSVNHVGPEQDATIGDYIDVIVTASAQSEPEEDEDNTDTISVITVDTQSPPPSTVMTPANVVSPTLSRMQSEFQGHAKEKESGMPSVMSILSSLTTGHSSRSHSVQPHATEEVQHESAISLPISFTEETSPSRVVAATLALVAIFAQLAFSPSILESRNLALVIRVHVILIKVASSGSATKARLTAWQFLMGLRADRDHRIFFARDATSNMLMLSSLVSRVKTDSDTPSDLEEVNDFGLEIRSSRPVIPQERDGRQRSRGRAGLTGLSHSHTRRSPSRAAIRMPHTSRASRQQSLWLMPEDFSFPIPESDPSEGLVSYDRNRSDQKLIFPVSLYLRAVLEVLENERNWEILSYVLCHLPDQLANKHLFCGPNSRLVISQILSFLCRTLLDGQFASRIQSWPRNIKVRDAQGLAYHTLSVLASYRSCFDLQQCHLLVEVFHHGLDGQSSTIKCCLHGLSLSAFELGSSMTKYLPKILEKLSQIMSNPNMAVHILSFLSIIGSLPGLYTNFTEGDFKMVFGVALQYLQHYNRHDASPTLSWALSQHVRILSFYVVYVWFLAVKLQDRPRHIPYITRQLLLANEGNNSIDDPTEVCFDWLARYSYATADPRPAHSVLNEIVMNPARDSHSSPALAEKTWIVGHSVVTIRSLVRQGWVEVHCRRPSGYSKFLCHVENAPLVGLGDVDPDLFSLPAVLTMERDFPYMRSPDAGDNASPIPTRDENDIRKVLVPLGSSESEESHPDPLTGYVWSRTAPSQRRKEVSVDPSYLYLQLSAYPDRLSPSSVHAVTDTSMLSKFVASLDRTPVIDTHKVGILYVAPGQKDEVEILQNTHGSPAYTRFLSGIGRLIDLRGQVDVYAGGLDPSEDGEYAYAWWDDIGQILYHTATMMPSDENDPQGNNKKRHIGNDYVRIIWNDSGRPYQFDTLKTQFQFVNIVIEPHSLGSVAAFSNNLHENEYFKLTVQRAPGMIDFTPIGHFKLISAENLPLLVRQLSLLADWFASVFAQTQGDTVHVEVKTNWRARLEAIRRFKSRIPAPEHVEPIEGIMGQERAWDFTTTF